MATQTGWSNPGSSWQSDTISSNGSGSASAGEAVLSAIQERTTLVMALAAAVAGALLGLWLANRVVGRRSASAYAPDVASWGRAAGKGAGRAGERARGHAEELADLASTGGGWLRRRGRDVAERGEEMTGKLRGGSRFEESTNQVRAGIALLPLAMKLLSNPIVRYYLRRTLARQLSRSFGR
jgi:hypothetical protein